MHDASYLHSAGWLATPCWMPHSVLLSPSSNMQYLHASPATRSLVKDPAILGMQVGEAAGRVHIEPFVPRQGVQIETDPKATSVNSATAMGDDEGAIEALTQRLQVGSPCCAALLGACCSSGVVCLWRSRLGLGHFNEQRLLRQSGILQALSSCACCCPIAPALACVGGSIHYTEEQAST